MTIVEADGTGDVFAQCPSDHPYVVGGGAASQFFNPGTLNDSFPATGDDSTVEGEENIANFQYGWYARTADSSSLVSAFAICAK